MTFLNFNLIQHLVIFYFSQKWKILLKKKDLKMRQSIYLPFSKDDFKKNTVIYLHMHAFYKFQNINFYFVNTIFIFYIFLWALYINNRTGQIVTILCNFTIILDRSMSFDWFLSNVKMTIEIYEYDVIYFSHVEIYRKEINTFSE